MCQCRMDHDKEMEICHEWKGQDTTSIESSSGALALSRSIMSENARSDSGVNKH